MVHCKLYIKNMTVINLYCIVDNYCLTGHKIYCKLPRMFSSISAIFSTSTLIRGGGDRDIRTVRFRNIFPSSAALCICIRHAQKNDPNLWKGERGEREKRRRWGDTCGNIGQRYSWRAGY